MFKKYLPIFLLTFVNIIGFTLLIPVLPTIVRMNAPEQWSGLFYGALITSYALFQFLGAPVLGSLSDKYGRRPLLFLSQLGTTLSWVIFGAAYFFPSNQVFGIGLPLYVIALSRVADGITGGNISVANAWISDITPSKEKTKIFGMMGGIFGVGFIIGPALGGLAASTTIGFLGSAIIAFMISLLTLFFIYYLLPESLPEGKRDSELEVDFFSEINIINKFKQFRSDELIYNLLVIRLFFALVFASYTTIIILFMEQQFGMSQTALGLTLSSIGLFSIVNQTLITHRFAGKYGNIYAIYVSIFLIFAGLVVLPLLPADLMIAGVNVAFILFMVNAYVMNLGISLGHPTFKSVLTNHVSETQQGMISGLDESLLAIGNAITPLIAGALYSLISVNTFFLYALLLLAPNLYYYYKKRRTLLHFQVKD